MKPIEFSKEPCEGDVCRVPEPSDDMMEVNPEYNTEELLQRIDELTEEKFVLEQKIDALEKKNAYLTNLGSAVISNISDSLTVLQRTTQIGIAAFVKE